MCASVCSSTKSKHLRSTMRTLPCRVHIKGRHGLAAIAHVGKVHCTVGRRKACTKPSEVLWVENICEECKSKAAVTARSRFMSASARGTAIALHRLQLPTTPQKVKPTIHRTLHKCNSKTTVSAIRCLAREVRNKKH